MKNKYPILKIANNEVELEPDEGRKQIISGSVDVLIEYEDKYILIKSPRDIIFGDK